ncbi:MAG: gliding motility-associated ABC transporter ATP-binding subunit GldA [Flavobacteriales bacterium]|jgi:ABC-2 type transport system ATP-binding protein|nr:MAG: gliding motility-associated ABC transporter ATP-binding subunit GldA [Flavobacteriales bacterium]
MSITVQGITKLYGTQKALNEVSFSVGSGEVVGFLGPNGAGKSTMMKILTCFLPPTHGTATVCGFDTGKDSLKVRRHVGYLPEHNPLYLDLYVKEYLDLVAGLHGMRNRAPRVKEMIELVGLGPEQHKRIGMLSKGYRQRVGLAQAMIHDPEVLILDEPTSGLDPNQLVDVRALIKRMGQKKTVMLSTHIMQEVEAICDRVIIIDRGALVADDKASTLRGSTQQREALEVEFSGDTPPNQLANIPGVLAAQRKQGHTWLLEHAATVDIRPAVFRYAVDHQLQVLGMQKSERALEDVFKELTRKGQ